MVWFAPGEGRRKTGPRHTSSHPTDANHQEKEQWSPLHPEWGTPGRGHQNAGEESKRGGHRTDGSASAKELDPRKCMATTSASGRAPQPQPGGSGAPRRPFVRAARPPAALGTSNNSAKQTGARIYNNGAAQARASFHAGNSPRGPQLARALSGRAHRACEGQGPGKPAANIQQRRVRSLGRCRRHSGGNTRSAPQNTRAHRGPPSAGRADCSQRRLISGACGLSGPACPA